MSRLDSLGDGGEKDPKTDRSGLRSGVRCYNFLNDALLFVCRSARAGPGGASENYPEGVMSPTASAAAGLLPSDERAQLQRNWWLFVLLGLVSIVVGFIALSCYFTATLASIFVFGWLLIVAGIAEAVHAILVRNGRAFALHLLAAALYLFTGFFMLEDPVRAAAVITLLLAASFLVGGVLRIIFSLTTQHHGWGWVFFNGIVNVVLGVLIWREWPSSALWVIGLFVAIDLLINGWTWVFVGLGLKAAPARA